ncbi:FadR/GntR family transcriptional regulator [Microbacterium tumbae]
MAVVLAAHFEKLIATGELAPGSRLPPERELAASFRVSRSSLREAMHELESKHLIERAPGRGTRVLHAAERPEQFAALSAEQAEQSHAAELRGIIEPSIASLAAVRATPANILQLHDVLDRSHESLLQAESLRLDLEFHLLLAQAAQNPLLSALQSMTSEWTSDVRQHSHSTRHGRRVSVEGHRAIFEAVQAHDADAASTAMAAHLADVRALIRKAAAD